MNALVNVAEEIPAKSRWVRFKEWLDELADALDYDPLVDQQRSMKLLYQEVEILKSRLADIEVRRSG